MSSEQTETPVQDIARVLWENFERNYPKATPKVFEHTFSTTEIFNMLNNIAPGVISIQDVAPKLLAMGYEMKVLEKPGPLVWCVNFQKHQES